MAKSGVLRELENHQRPPRRLDKIYGRKNKLKALSSAMHFDLFGGGDENSIVEKMDKLTVQSDTVTAEKPVKETSTPVRESPTEKSVKETSTPIQKQPTVQNPRRRLRRQKSILSEIMSGLTQEELKQFRSLLSLAKQKKIRDFEEYGADLDSKFICTKLGEGGYGEVFEVKSKDPNSVTDIERNEGIVLKVVPFGFEGTSSAWDTVQLPAILREAQLSLALDSLHGFVRCRGVSVVAGKYPDVFLQAFRTFKETHEEAENEDPDSYPPNQAYVIIEMNHVGTAIANLGVPSAFQAFDIFWQTVIILANAEQKLEFEHRDLHNGNICFKPRVRDGPIDVSEELITNMTQEPEVKLGLSNLQVTIIDYSLSRAKINGKEGEMVVFDPIEEWEEDLYHPGDEIDQVQFATYRKVRDWARAAQAQGEALASIAGTEVDRVDKYALFLPKSNVMWLGYLVRALLWRRGGLAKSATPGNISQSAGGLQSLLWSRLEAVADNVGGAPTLIPESAADLLETALSLGWLTKADLEAFEAEQGEL